MQVTERMTVHATPRRVYAAVSDLHGMARRSPECFAIWVWARSGGRPKRFVGVNRRRGFVWFTTCRVTRDDPDEEFAFDVTTFGLAVARWGYRIAARPGDPAAATEVTEYWVDRRGRAAYVLGRIFTGRAADGRPEANREGMRVTLARLRTELEGTGVA